MKLDKNSLPYCFSKQQKMPTIEEHAGSQSIDRKVKASSLTLQIIPIER